MKVLIDLKDPDGVSYSLDNYNDLSDKDREVISNFVSGNAYVSIEIDTEKNTAEVMRTYDDRI